MKKNSTLSKKLKNYSALAGTVTAAVAGANAQIIYTDVNPDVTVNGNLSGYALDLDNDANADFLFATVDTIVVGSTASITVKRVVALPYQSGNAIAGSTSVGSNATYIYPLALNNGDGIGAAMSWHSGTSNAQSMASFLSNGSNSASFGNWLGVTDKYIPLRFMIGGANHYGWARFDVVSSADQFTIKDYAYNGTADGGLQAGAQSGSAVGSVKTFEVAAYAFGKNVNVVFANSSLAHGVVSISNVMGQEVKASNINSQIMHIDMSDVAAGTYFVTVKQDNGTVTTKKVFID